MTNSLSARDPTDVIRRAPPAPTPTFPTPIRLTLTALGIVVLAGACKPAAPPPGPLLVADPAGSGAPAGAGVSDRDRGIAFVENGGFADAIPHFDKAIAARGDDAEAYYYRALCKQETHDASGAEADYREALELDGALVDAAINLGAMLLENAKRADDAIAVLARAAEKSPQESDLQANLAYAYRLKKQWDKSTATYEKALALAPPDRAAPIHFAAGEMLVQAGRDEGAAKHLRLALTGYANDPRTLVTLAHLFAMSKAFGDCVKAFDSAIGLQRDNAGWIVQRGVCKHETGDETAARNDYEAALAVDPKSTEAYYALGMSWLGEHKKFNARKAFEKAAELGGATALGQRAREKIASIDSESQTLHK